MKTEIVVAAVALIALSATVGFFASEPSDQGIPAGPPAAYINAMPQTGPLHISFCAIGEHVCIERVALAWGQVCDSQVAAMSASNTADYVDGFVPPLFHYAGWHCGKKFHLPTERVFGGGNWGN